MHLKNFRVNTDLIQLPNLDLKSAYLKLNEIYGENKVYIFESLAKNIIGSDYSIVGFDPILTIKIYKNTDDSIVHIQGVEKLTSHVYNLLKKETYITCNATDKFIVNNDNLLILLRKVQSLFKIKKTIDSFNFGFTGYFDYDTTWYIEKLPERIKKDNSVPNIYLSIYRGIISVDLHKRNTNLLLHSIEDFLPNQNIEALAETLLNSSLPEHASQIPQPDSIVDDIDKETYLKKVDKALKYIQIGDIYQVQLGHSIKIKSKIEPFHVYQRLSQRNPSPYMYLFGTDELSIIGASPELFVSLIDNIVTLRPIAGTIKKSDCQFENIENKKTLIADPKERAEHIMLVDLCRNDISRICKVNTLNVDKLMYLEEYSHLYHIVSNVTGKKLDSLDIYDVIFATFPEGTMTGAPKIRAMEIIEELETSRRGIYAGVIGTIDFCGDATLALCIRTAFKTDDIYQIRASAGIVADSVPEKEWNETLTKMQAVYWALTDKELVL